MYTPNFLIGLVNINSFIHAKGATSPYNMSTKAKFSLKKSAANAVKRIPN